MLAEQEGIHSGERNTDGKGKLVNHPSIDDIDPVSIADTDTPSEFDKEIKKRMKGEASMMKTKPADMGGSKSHTHEFKMGEKRTTTDEGHDHEIVYSDGKPVKTGPAPDDGHVHEL